MAKSENRPVLRQVGENIRRLRMERGMSQDQFAKIFGITQASVSWIEKGVRDPGIDFIFRIADEFKIPVSSVLPLDRSVINDDISLVISDLIRRKPQWKDVLIQLPHLSDRQMTVVVSMIECLAKGEATNEP